MKKRLNTLIPVFLVAFLFVTAGCIGDNSDQKATDCNQLCDGEATESSCISQGECNSLIEQGEADSQKKGNCKSGNVCCCRNTEVESVCERVCDEGAAQKKCMEEKKCDYLITLGQASEMKKECDSEGMVCCCK